MKTPTIDQDDAYMQPKNPSILRRSYRKPDSFIMADEQNHLSHNSILKQDQQNLSSHNEKLPGELLHEKFDGLDSPIFKDKTTLSKKSDASLSPAILTLISSMIGVGFLTLPNIGQQNGYVPTAIFILLASFLSLFANLQ